MTFATLSQFYRSKEWVEFRKVYLAERIARDGELIDDVTGQPIIHKYDAILHHVEPLTESNVNDYNISLNPDNIQLVSHATHNLIHQRFGAFTRHIYIVWGSPCAGKTTYVQNNALENDLIIDIDLIYKAINKSRSKRLYSNVMTIYRTLIDMVKTRNGQWVNAWIVMANCRNVEQTKNMLDAELVHIDTDKETCIERLKQKPYNKEYTDYFERYWDEYETYRKML